MYSSAGSTSGLSGIGSNGSWLAMTRSNSSPKGAVTITVQGATFCIPLAEVIDIAAERERLRKALEKLGKEASGIRAKLDNAAFVARAPEEVVDEQRARLEAAEEEIAILSAAEARLAAL